MNSSPLQRRAVPLSSSSGTSRRTEILPAPAYWNTWSIPSYRSREIGVTNSECSRSEEHTSELQSLMRISYAVFCLQKKNTTHNTNDKENTKYTRKPSEYKVIV